MASDHSKRRAAELFSNFLATSHEDFERAFEELCTEHSAEADELRGLCAVHRVLEGDRLLFGKGRREKGNVTRADGSRAGDTIGDFRLVSRIGSGGQGEVWEAEQLALKRRVALKLVLPERINEKTLALFSREARAGGRLAHPGIVAVHGYGQDDGKHWISQELVEGAWTLRDFIDEMRNEEELPKNYYPAVASFLAELAEALQAAHEAGVIHRDVKPQNILITPDDHPKLTDFGLARITDETGVSMTGDFAGTWLYMSPEQVTAKRIELDHRTDIFSLGVVMYEMLALVRPFDGDTTHQIAENIVYRDPPDLRKIKSRVPKDLAIICARALEKVRDGRFQTMAALSADLRRHLANEPILAQPPTMTERGAKWVRRNPTKSGIGFACMVLMSVILMLFSSLQAKSDALLRSNQVRAMAIADLTRTSEELILNLVHDLGEEGVSPRIGIGGWEGAFLKEFLIDDDSDGSVFTSIDDLAPRAMSVRGSFFDPPNSTLVVATHVLGTGTLMVFDRKLQLVAQERLGRVTRIQVKDILGGPEDEIIVWDEHHPGTDIDYGMVSVFGLSGDKLQVLFRDCYRAELAVLSNERPRTWGRYSLLREFYSFEAGRIRARLVREAGDRRESMANTVEYNWDEGTHSFASEESTLTGNSGNYMGAWGVLN